jgi:hypothetical protein
MRKVCLVGLASGYWVKFRSLDAVPEDFKVTVIGFFFWGGGGGGGGGMLRKVYLVGIAKGYCV